ncbi:MAG: hypothetical protein NTV09_00130 [Bacteroidetes bacterium]|nr:hypothetical protein [Bacteroidota bacterium]
MAAKLENFLEQEACIPEDVLINYSEGRLTSQQAHAVEKHLLECEFCSDALEGLKMMEPAKSKQIIADINKEIDGRIQSAGNAGAKVIPFRFNYKIAAVIALFIMFGGGYFYFKNKDEEKMLAQNNPSPATAISDSGSTQLIPQTNSDQGTSEPVSSQPKFSLAEKSPVPSSNEILTENKDVQQTIESLKNEDDAKKDQNDNLTLSDNVEVTPATAGARSQGQASEAAKTAPATSRSSEFARDEGSKVDDVSLKRKASPPDLFSLNVLFTKAKNKYKEKKYSEAANDFEKLMNDNATSFYDDAKWMLANCYMKTSRNAKAVILLREIAHSSSIHNKEAEALLQE